MNRRATYQEYREQSRELNSKLMDKWLDGDAITESARLLGLLGADETIVYDRDEEMSVQMDFALNEYRQNGQTAVEKCLEHEDWETVVEQELLEGLVRSYTSLFSVTSADEADCHLLLTDLLNETEAVSLTDINFSATATPGVLLFSRLVSLDELNMTTGAVLPFPSHIDEHLLTVYDQVNTEVTSHPESVTRYITFYKLYKKHGYEMLYE